MFNYTVGNQNNVSHKLMTAEEYLRVIQDYKAYVASIEDKIQSIQNELENDAKNKEELNRNKNELVQLKAKLANQTKDLESLVKKIEDLTNKISESKSLIADKESEIKNFNSLINSENTKINESKAKIDELKSKLETKVYSHYYVNEDTIAVEADIEYDATLYRIGSHIYGTLLDDGFLHFEVRGVNLKVDGNIVTKRNHKDYYITTASNIRNQHKSVEYVKARGQLVSGTILEN